MKILVLTSTLPRWQGDTEPRFVLDLSRHLAKEHDVLIVSPHAKGAETNSELEGVKVNRYRYFPEAWQTLAYQGGITAKIRQNPWRLFQIPFFLFFQWLMVRKLIKEWRPDVIHAHWIIPQAFIAVLASNRRIPILCTSHGGDLFGLRHPILIMIKRWVLCRCTSITVVSKAMQDEINKIVPGVESRIVPMGADLQEKFTLPHDLEKRKEKSLLFVGRIVPKKGLVNLINIMPGLIELHRDITLDIVGDGPQRQEIEKAVEASGLSSFIYFHGSLEHDKLVHFYREATIFVAPFVKAEDGDQEGLGLVLVEAAGCGCPIVCGDVMAARDVINEGNGLIVDIHNHDEFLVGLDRMLGDKNLRNRLAANANKYCKENFDWLFISKQYELIFDKIVEKLNKSKFGNS